MRYEALARENGELRGLREALPPVADRWLPAEIVTVQVNGLRQRLLLNRGARNGVFKGQAVLDDKGLHRPDDPRRPLERRSHPDHRSGARGAGADRAHRAAHHRGRHRRHEHARAALPAGQRGHQERRPAGDLGPGRGVPGRLSGRRASPRCTATPVQPLAQVRAAPLAHIDTDTRGDAGVVPRGSPGGPQDARGRDRKPDAVRRTQERQPGDPAADRHPSAGRRRAGGNRPGTPGRRPPDPQPDPAPPRRRPRRPRQGRGAPQP